MLPNPGWGGIGPKQNRVVVKVSGLGIRQTCIWVPDLQDHLTPLSLSILIKQMEMTSMPALEVWSMGRNYNYIRWITESKCSAESEAHEISLVKLNSFLGVRCSQSDPLPQSRHPWVLYQIFNLLDVLKLKIPGGHLQAVFAHLPQQLTTLNVFMGSTRRVHVHKVWAMMRLRKQFLQR